MSETNATQQDDSNEEPKAQVPSAPLKDSEIEMLKAAGMYDSVDAKDYQTNPNLAKAMMGEKTENPTTETKTVGGGNEVFTPSERFKKHQEQQAQQIEPEKRQYVQGMKFDAEQQAQSAQAEPTANAGQSEQAPSPQGNMPPFNPLADVETMSFNGIDNQRPVDNSQAINSSLNKTTAQLVTDGVWKEGYPWAMKIASKIPRKDIKEIMEDAKIPFSLKDKLLKVIYRFNESIEKNCYQSAKHIKEFEDALTLVLETHGYNNVIGPEGQLIYSIIKLGSVAWGQYQDNVELKEQTVMEIRQEIKNFTDEQDRKEAQKVHQPEQQAKQAA
jgi:hypothetical protein